MKRWQKLVPSLVLAVVGLALVPGLVEAQNYQQDFSANFPDLGEAGKVTVIIANDAGDTIVPYVDFPVSGLADYDGRHQFAARTGGADANQEASGVESVYTLNGVDTTETYAADAAETGGNGAYEPELGFLTDDFWTLSENGVGGILSAVAWPESYNSRYDQVSHTFQFKIDGFEDPANDQADGMGWSYLNSEQNGTEGVVGPGTSEEPAYGGSLGVGFDIWDNGGEGGNSVSLHYNSRVLESYSIDPGTTDPNTGEDWEFNSFEVEDAVFTATVIVTPGTPAISEPELKGGSEFDSWNRSGPAPEIVPAGDPANMEGFLRITEEAGGSANVVAFDSAGDEVNQDMTVDFDFRGLTTPGSNRADGMSFLLVPTELYDTEGADTIDFGPHEEPNLAGAFGVGFDTFNNDQAAQDEPEDMPDVGNHISVHYDLEKLSQENFELDDIDLVLDDPDLWHHAKIQISGDDVVITVTDGADGSEHVAFAESIDGLSDMGNVRPAFAARTGGAFDNYDIDNFLMFLGEVVSLPGDYDMNGVVDAADADAQAAAMKTPDQNLGVFDENGDGMVDQADRLIWVKTHAFDGKGTWVGDANLDGEFNSGDFVEVFTAGKYETGEMAGWAEGDWDGSMFFDSGDFVAAFTDGGYELGPLAAGVAAVPEPSSIVLLLLGTLLLVRRRR